MGDFNLQKLPPRRLQTLWEWKNRVLLEEYYMFNVVIPFGARNPSCVKSQIREDDFEHQICAF